MLREVHNGAFVRVGLTPLGRRWGFARGNALLEPRQRVPADVRRAVFERDGGRCVECGSGFDLQYDHVIPHSLGGEHGREPPRPMRRVQPAQGGGARVARPPSRARRPNLLAPTIVATCA